MYFPFEKNMLVEIKSTGVRLYVVDYDDDTVSLGLDKKTAIITVNRDEVINTGTTKFVWLNLTTGTFSDSWEISHGGFVNRQYHDSLLKEFNEVSDDDIRLIEYKCNNVDSFEFNHLMRLP